MRISTLVRSLAVICLVTLITLNGLAQTRNVAAKQGADAEFKALIEKYYAAWSSLDPNNAAQFYAKDADLIFYDIAPLQYKGWSEYKEGVQKAFIDQMQSGKLVPNNDLKVMRYGNVVVTSVTFHLSAKPKAGGSLELEGRHTAVWQKRGGKWLIVHEHISTPLPG